MPAVALREVEERDLPELFEHQRNPLACEMAAFPPRDCDAFMAHWRNVLTDKQVVKRTILADGNVAGYIVCFEHADEMLIGYWLGRAFWGRGIASQAIADFVGAIATRPLYARVAKSNLASIGVLEKCGFRISGETSAAAPTGGEPVEEFKYSLRS